jgi:hypothetical protein
VFARWFPAVPAPADQAIGQVSILAAPILGMQIAARRDLLAPPLFTLRILSTGTSNAARLGSESSATAPGNTGPTRAHGQGATDPHTHGVRSQHCRVIAPVWFNCRIPTDCCSLNCHIRVKHTGNLWKTPIIRRALGAPKDTMREWAELTVEEKLLLTILCSHSSRIRSVSHCAGAYRCRRHGASAWGRRGRCAAAASESPWCRYAQCGPCESLRLVRTRISETPVSLSIALVQVCARACPLSRDAFTRRPP